MILDQENTLSDQQALTATAISTNVIDLGPLGGFPTANTFRDIGASDDALWLYVLVMTALASAGHAATLTVTLESDDNTSLPSATTHWTSGAIAEASLVAGYEVVKAPIPPGQYQRYLGVRYTVGTENFTSGKVSAFIATCVQILRYYQNAEKNSIS